MKYYDSSKENKYVTYLDANNLYMVGNGLVFTI